MAGFFDGLFSAGGGQAGGAAAGLLSPPSQPKGFLPGLLSDPWLKLGFNLLARGGPSSRPHRFGQALAGAVGDLQAGEDADAQRQLQREELERLKRKNAAEDEERKRTAAWMDQMMSSPRFREMMGMGDTAVAPPAVGPNITPTPQ